MKAFRFERNALRFGQISLIVVLAIGGVLNIPYAIYGGALMLLSTLVLPAWAPQLMLYRWFVHNNWVNTAIYDGDPAPIALPNKWDLGYW